MSEDDPLPPGWHPMLQAPAPGRARIFLFDTPGGRERGPCPRMAVRRMAGWVQSPLSDVAMTADVVEETLSPIAWRYA
jgi:hypothetical protein